jgi:hypothetical protein
MGLTSSGIAFITLAWTIIITLAVFCFTKVIKSERNNK